MVVMPFLATFLACELLYCMIFLFLFEWRVKFSLFGCPLEDVIRGGRPPHAPPCDTTEIGTNRKPVCDFLLVINSN